MSERAARARPAEPPFGQAELVAAVAGATRVLDAGCGSGRLTIVLAEAGAHVTGIDTSTERLEQARRRASESGVELRLREGDFNVSLPFADATFDAVTSRLSLMAADDPVSTLREFARVLSGGGRVATAVWGSVAENPWFAAPREAVAAVRGPDEAAFARAFGRLGDVGEARQVHAEAGLAAVNAHVLRGQVVAEGAADHWTRVARDIGHFKRVDSALGSAEREAITADLGKRLERYRDGDVLLLPRMLVLVTAQRHP